MLCHHLDPATGGYVLDREHAPGDKAELTEPWPLTIDMTELVMPHKRGRHDGALNLRSWAGASVSLP